MATTDIYHVVGGLKGRNAVAFIGGETDDFIQINEFASDRVAANDDAGTFTAWINVPNVTETACTIIGCGDDNVVEFLELSIETGLLTGRCTVNTVAQWVTQADAINIKPHQWHHVAMVQDGTGSGVKLYVDGVHINATNDTATAVTAWFNETTGIDKADIGAANKTGDGADTQEFKGAISDVKYWNIALTDAQIMSDFKGTPNTTSLVSHWDMVENYNDRVTASNNDGTAEGDVTLCNCYSEFTSRLRYSCGVPLVADSVVCFADDGTGHAIVIQAA